MHIDLFLLKRFNTYFQYLQNLNINQNAKNKRNLICQCVAKRSKNEMEKPTNKL